MDHGVSITILRHGITAENEKHQYIGWSNPSLSKTGESQANDNRQQVHGLNEAHIYTSDLKRCTETAKILFPGCYLQEMQALREMNFGDWEGKSYGQLKENADYQEWLLHPFTTGPQNGELFLEFEHRVLQGFEAIRKRILYFSNQHSVIVTHGGVIRVLLMQLANLEKEFFDWKTPYASGYCLGWESQANFRRGDRCTSLQEVPTTVRQHG